MFKRIGSIVVFIALVAALVSSVQAQTGSSFDYTGAQPGGCSAGDWQAATYDLVIAEAFYGREAIELRAGDEVLYQYAFASHDWPVFSCLGCTVGLGGLPHDLEPGTILTATRVYRSGGVHIMGDSITFACDGDATGGGTDMVTIPDYAVVGLFLDNAPVYSAPDWDSQTDDWVMEVGKTAWVYGVDESGEFYKVMLSGRFFWVPVQYLGPNYDEVWNGTPLPTEVVD